MTTAPTPEPRLAGLRAHAAAQRRATVERLRAGVDALLTQGKPVTTRTIFDQTGLAYNSYARNPEAYALYRRASTHMAAQRRRQPPNRSATPAERDPWLAWPKTKLVARLRAALQESEQLRTERSYQATVCQEEHGVRIMLLEARLAAYRGAADRPRVGPPDQDPISDLEPGHALVRPTTVSSRRDQPAPAGHLAVEEGDGDGPRRHETRRPGGALP